MQSAIIVVAPLNAVIKKTVDLFMAIFSWMYPDEYLDSAYLIDYRQLYEDGYRGVIFDIDNTLVPQGAPSDERSRELIYALKDIGYKVMLLSNNRKTRVDLFTEKVEVDSIPVAKKPLTTNYKKAMEQMGTNKENTFFVGDQLFTDVWGAKLTGIKSILVKPIDAKEEIQIVVKRKLEKLWLSRYDRKRD